MIQSCSFSLRFYYVPTTPMTISLRPYYVLNTLSLRPHHALIWPRLCHDCFEQVQCCSTIITTMKTLPRSNLDLTTIYPFALRSYYAVPVCTTTDVFYTSVVRAWPSVMGVLDISCKAWRDVTISSYFHTIKITLLLFLQCENNSLWKIIFYSMDKPGISLLKM